MKMLVSLYAVNAISFVTNLAAILIFLSIVGPSGYGSYSIYIVFLALFFALDMALIKTAVGLYDLQDGSQSDNNGLDNVSSFFKWALVPTLVASVGLVFCANWVFPVDPETGVGGSYVMLIVVIEHVLSYPSNLLNYHWTQEKQFRNIYVLRLASTLLRHAFAWIVLWLTQSVYWALCAILLKGTVIGVWCWYWTQLTYSKNISKVQQQRPPLSVFITLYSFLGTSLVLLLMQEIPSAYIDRVYGREFLGIYRTLYDVTGSIWFLAALYPTVLFPYLLPRNPAPDNYAKTKKIRYISAMVAVFHLTFFFAVTSLLCAQWLFFDRWLSVKPFGIEVAAGVSMLGYSRFLIEAAQANGLGHATLGISLLTTALITSVLIFASPETAMTEIGWGWIIGQTTLLLLVKAKITSVTDFRSQVTTHTTVLVILIWLMLLLHKLMPLELVLLFGALGSLAGAAALLRLLFIWRNSSSNDPARVNYLR